MKVLLFLLLFTTVSNSSTFSQIYNPVKWSVASKKMDKENAVIFIKATIQQGWHIYGLSVPEGGPISTSIEFKHSNDFTLNGKIAGPEPRMKYEKDFKMNVPYYLKEVVFQQKIKLKSKITNVKGNIFFMTCDNTHCLPPDEHSFNVNIK